MDKLISVIIPVYNVEKYLPRCLDSVLAQTYQKLEIILVEDGAKDSSGAICDAYAKRDNRVVCRHKENGGVSSARNLGMTLAHGEYYHFLDGDDYLEPDAYETMLNLALEHQCDAVVCEFFASYPNRETPHLLPDDCYGLLDNKASVALIYQGNPFTWARLFHKSLVQGLRFHVGIARGEDGLFNLMALQHAQKTYYTNRPLYHYVQSEQSAVRGVFRPSQLTAMKLLDEAYPIICANYAELADLWMQKYGHLLISLYYDMYADEKNYAAQMKTVRGCYCSHYKEICMGRLSKKDTVKFRLFRYAPGLFCVLHKCKMK